MFEREREEGWTCAMPAGKRGVVVLGLLVEGVDKEARSRICDTPIRSDQLRKEGREEGRKERRV